MPEQGYLVDAKLLAAIRHVVRQEGQRRVNSEQRPDATVNDHQAPEVYVAKTPVGGIPAMGTAECEAYRIDVEEGLEAIALTLDVFSLYGVDAGDTYILVQRDKFGVWVAQSPASAGNQTVYRTRCMAGYLRELVSTDGGGNWEILESLCVLCDCEPGTGTHSCVGKTCLNIKSWCIPDLPAPFTFPSILLRQVGSLGRAWQYGNFTFGSGLVRSVWLSTDGCGSLTVEVNNPGSGLSIVRYVPSTGHLDSYDCASPITWLKSSETGPPQSLPDELISYPEELCGTPCSGVIDSPYLPPGTWECEGCLRLVGGGAAIDAYYEVNYVPELGAWVCTTAIGSCNSAVSAYIQVAGGAFYLVFPETGRYYVMEPGLQFSNVDLTECGATGLVTATFTNGSCIPGTGTGTGTGSGSACSVCVLLGTESSDGVAVPQLTKTVTVDANATLVVHVITCGDGNEPGGVSFAGGVMTKTGDTAFTSGANIANVSIWRYKNGPTPVTDDVVADYGPPGKVCMMTLREFTDIDNTLLHSDVATGGTSTPEVGGGSVVSSSCGCGTVVFGLISMTAGGSFSGTPTWYDESQMLSCNVGLTTYSIRSGYFAGENLAAQAINARIIGGFQFAWGGVVNILE